MSGPRKTNAELVEDLALTKFERDLMIRERDAALEQVTAYRKAGEVHPEAGALSKCIKALDAVAPTYSRATATSSYTTALNTASVEQATVRRILTLLASRYGVNL